MSLGYGDAALVPFPAGDVRNDGRPSLSLARLKVADPCFLVGYGPWPGVLDWIGIREISYGDDTEPVAEIDTDLRHPYVVLRTARCGHHFWLSRPETSMMSVLADAELTERTREDRREASDAHRERRLQ
ncbi:hypothetical protein AB0D11_37495 [Streptomyces monashensis]|uniref:hypothetical protein n=1 Tax=Streptomyces monashensis TaxID=1678012 RepID=UPI0033D43F62